MTAVGLSALLAFSAASCYVPAETDSSDTASVTSQETTSTAGFTEVTDFQNFNGYGERGDAIMDYFKEAFWKTDDRMKSEQAKSDSVTLWGYASYMEACGERMALHPDDQEVREEYIKALENVEHYRTVWRTDDLQVYQCVPVESQAECFFDDDVWVVLEFIHAYTLLGDQKWLDNAKGTIEFCYSGWDEELDGGVYWKEDDIGTDEACKNTCINAPLALASAELYKITREQKYLDWAIKLYDWTKAKLMDPEDYLMWDNINVATGNINRTTFTYNTGNMIASAAMLYELTQDSSYLEDAKKMAEAAYTTFGGEIEKDTPAESYYATGENSPWFQSSLLKGYIKLYEVDPSEVKYVKSFLTALAHACSKNKDFRGFLNTDWKERSETGVITNPDLLNQSGNARVLLMLQNWKNAHGDALTQ